jgi:hypothetical protein
MKKYLTIAFALTLMAPPLLEGQEPSHDKSSMADCPMMNSESVHEQVDERGDQTMGFSHEKTTHHFRLLADGGAIEVAANEPADATSRDQVRTHLAHIAKLFAEGNFAIPMLVHARTPPGSELMQQLRGQIKYGYEEMPAGGRVRITTTNPKALAAVHKFLRFQIEDHRTGDSLEVKR